MACISFLGHRAQHNLFEVRRNRRDDLRRRQYFVPCVRDQQLHRTCAREGWLTREQEVGYGTE